MSLMKFKIVPCKFGDKDGFSWSVNKMLTMGTISKRKNENFKEMLIKQLSEALSILFNCLYKTPNSCIDVKVKMEQKRNSIFFGLYYFHKHLDEEEKYYEIYSESIPINDIDDENEFILKVDKLINEILDNCDFMVEIKNLEDRLNSLIRSTKDDHFNYKKLLKRNKELINDKKIHSESNQETRCLA